MSISIPGFSAPPAGLEASLEMLSARHSRIERSSGLQRERRLRSNSRMWRLSPICMRDTSDRAFAACHTGTAASH